MLELHNYLTRMNDEYLLLMVVKVDPYMESIGVELVYMIDLGFMLYMGSFIICLFVILLEFLDIFYFIC